MLCWDASKIPEQAPEQALEQAVEQGSNRVGRRSAETVNRTVCLLERSSNHVGLLGNW